MKKKIFYVQNMLVLQYFYNKINISRSNKYLQLRVAARRKNIVLLLRHKNDNYKKCVLTLRSAQSKLSFRISKSHLNYTSKCF